MRGEYNGNRFFPTMTSELPPRARRIRYSAELPNGHNGTTSACAENTFHPPRAGQWNWNYLRVRGEYSRLQMLTTRTRELPPRARRIHLLIDVQPDGEGTTSACAENTPAVTASIMMVGNYLRVRGEYSPAESSGSTTSELPPRARRIHEYQQGSHPKIMNYLRVRGEYNWGPGDSGA